MKSYKLLWTVFVLVMMVTFTILGYYGREVYKEAPPIPEAFVSTSGSKTK